VGEYRLSRLAREQIRDIGRFTLKRFGHYQAKAYHAGLERTFGLLADFPMMGVEVAEILVGLRRFRFQSHVIFYSLEPHGILIRAVLHAAQNARPELFE
jgi:toxin ParE1/3/4